MKNALLLLTAALALSFTLPAAAQYSDMTGTTDSGQGIDTGPQSDTSADEADEDPEQNTQPATNPSQPNKKTNFKKLAPIPDVGTGAAARSATGRPQAAATAAALP